MISQNKNEPIANYCLLKESIEGSDLPLVLTVTNLAQSLMIGRNSAYALLRSKKIRSIRVGRQLRIPREALLEFLSSSVS